LIDSALIRGVTTERGCAINVKGGLVRAGFICHTIIIPHRQADREWVIEEKQVGIASYVSTKGCWMEDDIEAEITPRPVEGCIIISSKRRSPPRVSGILVGIDTDGVIRREWLLTT
jgi:hypothetical protein